VTIDPRERESIVQDLASGDEDVRRLAVERLVLLPPAEALPRLAERLGDESWRVRKSAIECLAAAPEDWPVVTRLVAALADGDNPGRRNAAVEALVRVGRRAVEPLLAAVGSSDVDVRKLVVDALAGIGSERAVTRLVETLADADPNVRSASADALGAIGGADAAHALTASALREGEAMLVRFSALRALARLEAPLRASQLSSALSDPGLRPVAFGVLGHGDDPEAEEHLLKGLAAGSRATREAAIEALLRITSRAVPAAAERLLARMRETTLASPSTVADAIARLDEADLGVRLMLVQFLGVVGSPEAVLPLLGAARDEALAEVVLETLAGFGDAAERVLDERWGVLDVEGRALACELLGRTTGVTGALRLSAALEDGDPSVRVAAARGLARRADPAALPALIRRLELTAGDPEPEAEDERDAATEALVAIATRVAPAAARRHAVGLLLSGFEAAEEPVRLAIARVLREVGGPEHAERMALLVQDPSPAVRRAAVAALARVGADGTSEWLRLALADEDSTVRVAAATALGESGGAAALDDLARLLGDEDPTVRAAAWRAVPFLSCWQDATRPTAERDRVEQLLGDALADVAPVAIAAVEACERLAGIVSIEPVRKVLAHPDPEVVQSAVRCLARHQREDELARLQGLLAHPHWAVRADLIQAFADRRLRAALPAVLRRLELEQDPFVRDVLLRALASLEEG
jgi:HEAT repeat protein